MTVAKIALSAATFAIDRPYSYRVPPALAGVNRFSTAYTSVWL